jgi:hypothetical protein
MKICVEYLLWSLPLNEKGVTVTNKQICLNEYLFCSFHNLWNSFMCLIDCILTSPNRILIFVLCMNEILITGCRIAFGCEIRSIFLHYMGYQIHQRSTDERLFNFWSSPEILIDLNDNTISLFDLILGLLFTPYKAPVNAFLLLDV